MKTSAAVLLLALCIIGEHLHARDLHGGSRWQDVLFSITAAGGLVYLVVKSWA